MSNENFYHPELDGLRFFAFLLVFIHHAPALTDAALYMILHDYGWMGVDLFLCLSAFLFARLLYIEHTATGGINIKNFYIRRALRIWPLYFVFLGIALFITALNVKWDANVTLRVLGMSVFADNIFSAVFGYNQFVGSGHLWTISYEEQFYAVIPWFLRKMFSVDRRKKIFNLLLIFIIFSLIKAAMIYANARPPTIWVLPLTHFESILGGLAAGLGVFDDQIKKLPAWLLMIAGLVCLAVVCTLPSLEVIGWSLMLTYPLVGLGMSLILVSLITGRQWFAKTMIRSQWLAYLGKISYGLYVYHLVALDYGEQITIALGIFPKRLVVYPLSVFIIGMFITILTASISYRWLEKPFLRLKERFSLIRSRPI